MRNTFLVKSIYFTAIVLLITIAQQALAQRLPKYENVYKDAIAAANKGYAYTLFTEYLKQNPASPRANLYFQLGTLAFHLSKAVDPFAQYADFVTYSDDADSYLKLCMKYLNESEVKRDNELFIGIASAEKKLTFEEVYNYVNQQIESNRLYTRNVRKIYEPYKGFITHYTISQNSYKAFCQRFINLKDAYLQIDTEITDEIEEIANSFDSANYYLQEYKSLMTKEPAAGYNAQYSVQKIETYRIDGLTPINFRNTQSIVWDYGEWANRFQTNSDTFARLYQAAIDANNELSKRISTFNKNRTLSDNYLGYEIDETVLDSLNAFGYFPVLNRLIRYKEAKLNFLTQSRRKMNSADYDGTKTNLPEKAAYYNNLQSDYNKLEKTRKSLADYAANNKTAYLSANFNSQNEFTEYLSDELFENKEELNLAYENLKKHSLADENNIRRTRYINYKKQEIPLYLGNGFYRSSSPSSWITKCIVPATSGNGFFMAGSSISREGFSTAYIAMCSADSATIHWLKNIDIGRMVYDNCATALCPATDGGCFAIIIAKNVSDPSLMYSTVIHFDAKGNEVKRLTLPEKTLGIGRYIRYEEQNDRLLMAFYGSDEFYYDPNGKLVIQEIDMNNNMTLRAEMILNGEPVDIIKKKNNSLLVVGNYTSLVDEDGEEYKLGTKDGNIDSRIFSALISSAGKLSTVTRYNNPASCYAIKVLKTNDDLINIIGQQAWGRKDNAIPYAPADLVYIQIDSEGKLLSSNIKPKQEN